jgi:hypothetical protein
MQIQINVSGNLPTEWDGMTSPLQPTDNPVPIVGLQNIRI